MLSPDTFASGQHVMTVCNACRYCEGYCPVFPAMENRLSFAKGDLAYLANLCHNCGECLYACQYAPPHEFGINVPRTLAEIRLESYEEYCWPRFMAAAFRHSAVNGAALRRRVERRAARLDGDVGRCRLAGAAGRRLLQRHPARRDGRALRPRRRCSRLVALAIGVVGAALARSIRGVRLQPDGRPPEGGRDWQGAAAMPSRCVICTAAARTAPTPRNSGLRGAAGFITDAPMASRCASRRRRVAASITSCSAGARRTRYASLPVVLGTLGGVGLLVGPLGLFALRRRRDPALSDPVAGAGSTSRSSSCCS